MRDALSILASSTVLPPSATPPGQYRRRNRHSTPAKPLSQLVPKSKLRFSTSSPLISSSQWNNRRSLRYYTELASKLAEDGRLEEFLMIAETVLSSGMEASEFLALLNARSIGNGIVRVINEGKLNNFVEVVLNGVHKLGIEPVQLFDSVAMESLKGECRRLLKRGEVEQLLSLMETLVGFQFSIKELIKPLEVISLCVDKKNPNAAARYAQNFPHMEILFCSIILEFGKRKDLASALTAFEALKQKLKFPNMHAYRTIIDVCGLCGDYLKSRAIYEELLACNITPNIYVFNSLMNVNSCDLNYTLDVYKQMERFGVAADITSHNILLKSCCLAAKVEIAKDIYGKMRKLEAKGALKLDVFTYSTMIKVFADAKMWKLALEIKDDMAASGVVPNTITWSSLISACANAGLVEQTLILFDEMLQAGCQPNSQCFNILLHACVEACQYDRAFRLFQSWKEMGSEQNTNDDKQDRLEEYVAGNNKKQSSSRPYSHLTRRVQFRPTTTSYNILMKACGTDYHHAKSLMDEMKISGLSPNNISWSILIDICGSSGNVPGALQILRSMREVGIQPDVIAYTTAIKICVDHKKPKLASLLFAEMKKFQVKPNSVTYNTMLRACSRYGSLQEVRQLLAVYQDMRKAGYKPNDYYLKQLIEEWCEGVIQNGHQKKTQFASLGADFVPQSLLVEKVAEYLQDSKNHSHSIDLRGLTKLEARIVVLAVLRKIKENYIGGNAVQDDLFIIFGVQELGTRASSDSGIRKDIIRLLQHDLGLQVFSAASSTGGDTQMGDEGPKRSRLEEVHGNGTSESLTRRPAFLQSLRVTRESLHHWLQKRTSTSTQLPSESTYANA